MTKKHIYEERSWHSEGSDRITYCGRTFNLKTTALDVELDRSFLVSKHTFRELELYCKNCLRGVGVEKRM